MVVHWDGRFVISTACERASNKITLLGFTTSLAFRIIRPDFELCSLGVVMLMPDKGPY